MSDAEGRVSSRSTTVRRRVRQVRAWVRYRRWRLRCAHCGLAFLPVHSVHGYGNTDEHFHDVCIGYRNFRHAAEERLEVLAYITEVWEITASDIREGMALRTEDHNTGWNMAFRVFYDLDNRREAAAND